MCKSISQPVIFSCILLIFSGCLSFPSRKCSDSSCGTNQCDTCTQGQECESCQNGCNQCENGCDECGCDECKGPKRYSEEWYAIEAQTPVGAPQKCKKGKLWPPFPRPQGKRQQFCHRYHAAHYWPHPYNCQDRSYVRQVVSAQEQKGWTEETTLFEYHFDEETQQLNHSGIRHLQWIVDFAPPEHKMIWIQKTHDSVINEQRLANVHQQVAVLQSDQGSPGIALRTAAPTGRPALEINAIRLAEIESMPDPRVEYYALPTGAQ